jgi:hypothetical protein
LILTNFQSLRRLGHFATSPHAALLVVQNDDAKNNIPLILQLPLYSNPEDSATEKIDLRIFFSKGVQVEKTNFI